jgi:hypothetical protein
MTVVTEQDFTFTTEEAMSVEVVPQDEIITPEPVDPSVYFDPLSDVIISPDSHIGAWVDYVGAQQHELQIGVVFPPPSTPYFSAPISGNYRDGNILIGWRPSNYPYPVG